MFIITRKSTLAKVIADVHADALRRVEGELAGIKNVTDLSARVKTLQGQVSDLEIQKSKREEEFARKEREIEHKVGLERKRQEFELESGKKEATLKVREENLKADKERFAEQMSFHEKRFTEEVGYLKEMVANVLERLPNITADLSPSPARKR